MYRYFYLTVIILIVLSCKPDPIKQTGIINLAETSDNIIATENLFDSVEFILLHSPLSKPVGKVIKVIPVDDKFFVLYSYKDINQNYLHAYSQDGKFLFELGGDADHLSDFNPGDITALTSKSIAVYDLEDGIMITFSTTGKKLTQIKLGFPAKEFVYLASKQLFVFHAGGEVLDHEDNKLFHDIIVTDTAFSVQEKYFAFEIPVGQRERISLTFALQEEDNLAYFHRLFSDTIYTITPRNIDLKTSLTFKLKDRFDGISNGEPGTASALKKILDDGGVMPAGQFLLTQNHLYFQYATMNVGGVGIYDRLKGEVLTGKGLVDKDNNWLGFPVGKKNNYLFSYLNEFSLEYAPESFYTSRYNKDALEQAATYLIKIKEK